MAVFEKLEPMQPAAFEAPDGPAPSDSAAEQLDAGLVGEEGMNYLLEVAWESDRLDVLDEADR